MRLVKQITDLNQATSINAINHNNSNKYQQCNTRALIDLLTENYNLNVINLHEARVRKESNQGYQNHFIALSNDDLKIDDHNQITIILKNNHLGTGSLELLLGVYRSICSNGMIVGNDIFSERIRHIGSDFKERMLIAATKLIENAPSVRDTVKHWMSVDVSPENRIKLAEEIIKLRVDQDKIVKIKNIDKPIRLSDRFNDLWTTFNRSQEQLIKGGTRLILKSVDNVTGEETLHNTTTRKLSSVNQIVELNKKAWTIAEKFAA